MPESLFNKVAVLFPVFRVNKSISLNQYLCVSSVNAGKRRATLLKRGSNTSFFLSILLNSYKHLFWITSANRCFSGLLDTPCEVMPLNNFILQYLHHKQFVFHFQKWKHCIYKRWIANFARFILICKHRLRNIKWENQKCNKQRKL